MNFKVLKPEEVLTLTVGQKMSVLTWHTASNIPNHKKISME